MEYFDIWAIDEGEFYVNSICGTRDNFKWALVAVYGLT
jgi:hypothetical protein